MTSSDGIAWTSQFSATGFGGNSWSSVAYGNDLWVAVSTGSQSGTRVMTSSDGIAWTVRTSIPDNLWQSVAYGQDLSGNPLWVAVASSGGNRVMTSVNGTNWTLRTSNPSDNNWQSVAYGQDPSGNPLWVAVANSGTSRRVMTSSDGITWLPTPQPTGTGNAWRSVAYGDGLWVAVASDGTNRVMTSENGTHWTVTPTSTPAEDGGNWTSVAYGDGLWAAVSEGGARVMTSGVMSFSTQLVLTQDAPTSAQSGAAFSTAPVVEIRDAQNAKVAGATDTVTASIASGPAGATLSGHEVNAVAGVATFSGLTLNGPVGTYTIEFASGSLTKATSQTITLGVGPASGATSVITASPASAVPADGTSTSTVTVELKDSGDNALTSSGGTVTLQATIGTLGGVTDKGDGTYTAVLTSSSFGTATINGTVGGAAITDTATVQFTSLSQAALSVSSDPVTFDGSAYTVDLGQRTSGGSGTGLVSYAVVNGTASACNMSGLTLTASSAGTCLVTATKAADAQYDAQTSSQASITFTKATRTLSFGRAASVTLEYGAGETFVATPSAGASDGTLTYTMSDPTPAGCDVVNASTRQIRMTASTGSCVVTATISAGSDHLSATVQVEIVRTRKAITITGGSPSVSFGTVYTPTALTGLVFSQVVDHAQTTYTFTGISGTVFGPTSTMPVNAGKYHVLPSDLVITGGSASDYDITYVPGVLEIRRVARTVAFTSPATATVQYGDTTAVIATPSVGDGTIAYSVGASTACSVDAASGVVTVTSASGTCVVDATVTGGTNHLDATTTSPVTITVGPRPITVTAGTGSVALGGTVTSSFSVTTGTMAGTDRISSVTFTYEGTGSTSYDASVTPPTALGTYSVTPTLAVLGSGSVADYTITYAPGTLSIVTPPPPPPPRAEPEEEEDEETVTGGSSVVPRVPDAPRPTGPTQPVEEDAGSTAQPVTRPTSPNVTQGPPTPELDRRAGGPPALSPGQIVATSGGSPEPVSVAAIPGRAGLAVAGAGWAITVDLGSGGSATEDAGGAVVISLVRSSVATTSGTGFLPGTEVSVWMFSEPTLMMTVIVDEDGEFSSEFLVDTLALEPGPHTLQVQGVGADGFIRAVNVGLLVAPESALFESAEGGAGADGRGTPWWLLSSLLLGLLLAAVVLTAVRSRHAAD